MQIFDFLGAGYARFDREVTFAEFELTAKAGGSGDPRADVIPIGNEVVGNVAIIDRDRYTRGSAHAFDEQRDGVGVSPNAAAMVSPAGRRSKASSVNCIRTPLEPHCRRKSMPVQNALQASHRNNCPAATTPQQSFLHQFCKRLANGFAANTEDRAKLFIGIKTTVGLVPPQNRPSAAV